MTDNAIDPGSGGAARAALASLIDLHGPALLHEPDRLKRQLDGALPDAGRDVDLILSSMREEVPHALLAAHSDEQLRTLFPQLVDRLVKKTGVAHGAATWAVRTWAHALAVTVEGGPAERPEGMRRAVDRRPDDGAPRGVGDGRSNDPATERQILEDREASRRSATAEVLGFGSRQVRQKAPSTVRPPGPSVPPPPAAETLVAFDAFRERAVEVAPQEAPEVSAIDAPSAAPALMETAAPAPIDASRDAEVPVPAVVTTSAPEEIVPVAFVTAAGERAADPASHDQPPVEPAAAHVPAVEAPSDTASAAVAAAFETAVPAASTTIPAADPVFTEVQRDVQRPPPPETPAHPTPLPFAPQRRSSSRTFALAAAIAAAVIVVGATLWPAPPGSVTELRAPAYPPSAARPNPVVAVATAPPPAPVATPPVAPAPVSQTPVDKPSEPLAATAPPASPTSQAQGPAEVPPPAPERVAPATPEPGPASAVATAPTVIASTPAIPKPVTRVVKPDALVGKPVTVVPTAPKLAKAVEPRKPMAASAACTRSNCGSVVSVRAIDDAATRDYEVIVRLDDRTIRAMRMPARWSPGARVRVVGNRIEPAGER